MLGALVAVVGCAHPRAAAAPPAVDPPAPRADSHTHLTSPYDSAYLYLHGIDTPVQTAPDLIAALDSAHVRRALVLSTAYMLGAPDVASDSAGDEYAAVRADNDWVAAQVARYPGRLVGFCAVNPLRPYALREIARCRSAGLRGLKLHLANSRVDLERPGDAAKVRAAFAAANAARLPILVHLRGGVSYGADDARAFIAHVLPAAPDVPVQIAHLAGWGSYDAATDAALGVFVDAMRSGAIDRSQLYFDLAAVFTVVRGDVATGPARSPWTKVIVQRVREIGLAHVLFGTDWPSARAGSPRAVRAFVLNESGLTRDEVERLFASSAPYLE